jgi:hypothetical protein
MAIIYTNSAKVCFTIKDKKFSFKDRMLYSPTHPQKAYLPEEPKMTKKKNNQRRRKNKARPSLEETVNNINTI